MQTFLAGATRQAHVGQEELVEPDADNELVAAGIDGEDEEWDGEEVDDEYEDGEEEPTTEAQGWTPLKIVSDGVEHIVEDKDEAIRLLQFGKTFTQRNQALIEEKKAFEQRVKPAEAQLHQQMQQYAAALPQLEQLLAQTAGPPPDPAQYTDHTEYLWAKDQWQTRNGEVQAVQIENQRIQGELQKQAAAKATEWRNAQAAALAAKMPEWANDEVATQESKQIAEYGLSMGLTNEEIGQLYDHRFVLILRDAMKYRTLDANGKEKVQQARTKTAAPGTGARPKPGRRRKKMRQALKASGDQKIAGQLLAEAFKL